MLDPANDNTLPRPTLYRAPGTYNPDTGLPKLIALPAGAVLGPISWPADAGAFPNDYREA